ncbi:hypothetical protein, partial [Micromonospora chersina]|uniref:hypothetical protein n=1 Tax=Micromonospora chersina TaxID=47854 RepID=UPI003400620E
QIDRDEALAKQRNAQHADEVALVDAVYSDDPDVDLAAIAGRHQKSADEDVAKARAIVAAFRRPSLQTTHDYVSQLVENAETVEAHLAPELAKREAKVAKARAALAAAEAEAAEVTELIWYFNAANNSITNYTVPTVPAHVRIADGSEQ